MAFEAGTAYVAVLPQASGFLSGLQRQIAPALASIQKQGVSSGAAIGVAFVAAGALAAKGLVAALHATESLAGATLTLQRTTGLAAEQASGLIFVADSLGVGVDKLNIGFGLLAKNIQTGSAQFAQYNIATTDASGNQLDLIQILGNVSAKYAQVGGGLKGAALAQQVFGRSGKALIPILQQGASGIQALFDKAQQFGLIIGQDTVDNVFKLQVATRELGASFKGFEVQVGVALVPVVQLLVEGLTALVGVLHLIPAPVVDIVGVFLVLSGGLIALVAAAKAIGAAWGTLGTALTGGASAATLQAEATTAQLAASESLAAVLPELTAALGALAAAQTVVAETGGAMAAALTADAAAAAAEDVAIVGFGESMAAAGVGATAAAGGLGALGAILNPVTVGIVATVGAVILLTKAWRDNQAAFEAGVQKDLVTLTLGSDKAAASVRKLALQAPKLDAFAARGVQRGQLNFAGPTPIDPTLATKADQAAAALARYNQMQVLAAGSSVKLASTLAGTVRAMTDVGDTAFLSATQVAIIDASVSKLVPGLDRFAQASGTDLTQIVGDFKAVADNAKSKFPEVQAAAVAMVAKTKQAFADWHDSIVSNFGGAGTALDVFASKANVDLSRATNHITQYTRQIGTFGANLKTITDEFGKRAQGFIQWATQQGLAQAGLVQAVAEGSKKDAKAFVAAWGTAKGATDSLATQIQTALDPAMQAIIDKLTGIKKALQGKLGTAKVETSQATGAIGVLQEKLNTLGSHPYTASVFVKVFGAGGLPFVGWATGFHGTVTKPTLALVGEHGPERVDVGPGGVATGPGRISGQLAITDWHRGVAVLDGELDNLDRTSGR